MVFNRSVFLFFISKHMSWIALKITVRVYTSANNTFANPDTITSTSARVKQDWGYSVSKCLRYFYVCLYVVDESNGSKVGSLLGFKSEIVPVWLFAGSLLFCFICHLVMEWCSNGLKVFYQTQQGSHQVLVLHYYAKDWVQWKVVLMLLMNKVCWFVLCGFFSKSSWLFRHKEHLLAQPWLCDFRSSRYPIISLGCFSFLFPK